MDEPIVIERAGTLDFWEQEAGYNRPAIEIDGESLDAVIACAVGLPMKTSSAVPQFDGLIGRCELVLRIWPVAEMKDRNIVEPEVDGAGS